MKSQKIVLALATLISSALGVLPHAVVVHASPEGTEAALAAKDVGAKLFPEKVFYRGQLAPTQLRNTGGVHFADDVYFVAGLCDNSGYASDVKQKFRAYLLSEVPLELGGKSLPAGAYGFGFINGQAVVTDLGAHDLWQVSSAKDAEIKRPTPLQVLPSSAKGTYRLYIGRDYVEFHRSK